MVTDGGEDDGLEELDRGRSKADNLLRDRLGPDSPRTSKDEVGRDMVGVDGAGSGWVGLARDTSVV